MKNYYIKIVENIDKYIIKEYAISEIVRDISNSIIKRLKEEEKIKNYSNYEHFKFKNGLFPIYIKEQQVNIEWRIFKCKDEEGKKIFCQRFKNLNQWKGLELSQISIVIGKYGEKYLDDYSDVVYHEVEHAFQAISSGKDFSDTDKYRMSISNLSKGKFNKEIGFFMYLHNTREQDAFANGLYGSVQDYLKNGGNPSNVDKYIKDTLPWRNLNYLYNFYDDIQNNIDNEEVIGILKTFKIDERWENLFKKIIASYTRKLARVIFKIHKEIRDKFLFEIRITEPIKPYTKYLMEIY